MHGRKSLDDLSKSYLHVVSISRKLNRYGTSMCEGVDLIWEVSCLDDVVMAMRNTEAPLDVSEAFVQLLLLRREDKESRT